MFENTGLFHAGHFCSVKLFVKLQSKRRTQENLHLTNPQLLSCHSYYSHHIISEMWLLILLLHRLVISDSNCSVRCMTMYCFFKKSNNVGVVGKWCNRCMQEHRVTPGTMASLLPTHNCFSPKEPRMLYEYSPRFLKLFWLSHTLGFFYYLHHCAPWLTCFHSNLGHVE